MIKRKGYYFGTEIDGKWWKRYKKNKMFARGNGEYWYDSDTFSFRRYLTKVPITIHLQDITETQTGKWHSGKWGSGRKIIKIIWQSDGINLSSGFLLSRSQTEAQNIEQELQNFIKAKKASNKSL